MNNKHLIVIGILLLMIPALLLAGGKTEDSGYAVRVDSSRIAAGGADVLAYYDLPEGAAAVIGSDQFAYEWLGATWQFSSAENRDKFAADPQAFAPAFGGYCAWAMARNKLATIDPDMWFIEDGTLYLNYNEKTHKDWLSDRAGYIEKAVAAWPGIASKLTDSP